MPTIPDRGRGRRRGRLLADSPHRSKKNQKKLMKERTKLPHSQMPSDLTHAEERTSYTEYPGGSVAPCTHRWHVRHLWVPSYNPGERVTPLDCHLCSSLCTCLSEKRAAQRTKCTYHGADRTGRDKAEPWVLQDIARTLRVPALFHSPNGNFCVTASAAPRPPKHACVPARKRCWRRCGSPGISSASDMPTRRRGPHSHRRDRLRQPGRGP